MYGKQMKLALGVTLALFATAGVVANDFTIDWWTIDAGGDMWSSGGDFELSGTIGQLDATSFVMIGDNNLELTGGFWFRLAPGDCDTTGCVDLFDYAEFESCLAGPDVGTPAGCECFDVNRSDTVDLRDFTVVQAAFTGS